MEGSVRVPEEGRLPMSLSPVLWEKWDRLLYNWILWRGPDDVPSDADARISTIYTGEEYRGGYRNTSPPVLSGDAMDTDALMSMLRDTKAYKHLYRALKEWTLNDGTRGMQAARLAIHENTLRAHVEAGIELLESMWRERRQSKSPRAIVERQ